ncbi:hypothetical protein [Tepidibacter mesophilus]|uniref:hypothetical protein n=1 Tax=Tepidibacter mesophilus TaxID=655607 RepID=UPI000C0740CC|nr:hypothetical protein [Tepidibacter mesophilus]
MNKLLIIKINILTFLIIFYICMLMKVLIARNNRIGILDSLKIALYSPILTIGFNLFVIVQCTRKDFISRCNKVFKKNMTSRKLIKLLYKKRFFDYITNLEFIMEYQISAFSQKCKSHKKNTCQNKKSLRDILLDINTILDTMIYSIINQNNLSTQ